MPYSCAGASNQQPACCGLQLAVHMISPGSGCAAWAVQAAAAAAAAAAASGPGTTACRRAPCGVGVTAAAMLLCCAVPSGLGLWLERRHISPTTVPRRSLAPSAPPRQQPQRAACYSRGHLADTQRPAAGPPPLLSVCDSCCTPTTTVCSSSSSSCWSLPRPASSRMRRLLPTTPSAPRCAPTQLPTTNGQRPAWLL